jgi:hypothetical protein
MDYMVVRLNEVQQQDRTSTGQTQDTPPVVPCGSEEWPALEDLRKRYQEDRDLFSTPERARLRFLRWLVQTDRLAR